MELRNEYEGRLDEVPTLGKRIGLFESKCLALL